MNISSDLVLGVAQDTWSTSFSPRATVVLRLADRAIKHGSFSAFPAALSGSHVWREVSG